MKWEIDHAQSTPTALVLKGSDGSAIYGPDGTKRDLFAFAAEYRDGCLHLWTYFNGYEVGHECSGETCPCSEQYVHICDIDAYIDQLRSLKEAIQKEQP